MKVLIPIKRVVDANVSVHVKGDNTGIETANVKMAMNPFCEIAVEEAIRLQEAGKAEETIAVTIGSEQCQDVLRTALAMGVDRAILIKTEEDLQPLAVSKVLKALVDKELPNLVILGKQAIDNDNNQTGQKLSALLSWSQGTFASRVEINGEQVNVTREIDGGLETITLKLPAVLTTDLRLNEPRYVKLPNIMKAKKKPLDIVEITEFDVDIAPRFSILSVEEPAKRSAGIKVADVTELVDKLQNEAKVI